MGFESDSTRLTGQLRAHVMRGGFLGDEFAGRFDNRAKWITELAGVFPVGVVNAPELVARLRSHGYAHAWQFTISRDSEDVSATQNARTVPMMSGMWSRKYPASLMAFVSL